MDNPTLYIYGAKVSMIDLEAFEVASNLDYAQAQCIKSAGSCHSTQVVYKLVPVFEASVEVITRVIETDLTKLPPPNHRPAEEGSW